MSATPNPIIVPMTVLQDLMTVRMAVMVDRLSLPMETAAQIVASSVADYEGSYEFTPTDEAQTVEIADRRAVQNITINPIPSNYGKITWDGAVITVS